MTCVLVTAAVFVASLVASLLIAAFIAASRQPPEPPSSIDCRSRDRHPTDRTRR